ncbi:unnamed protein product [Aspergillus oryzae]|uniref:Unnamed protein product n=2 Tax=Aspergillus oryzae TaxID=5062 RepID=A0AAN5C418_ASPOZ|nr:unnamed protein product [Aspergillus oryzae]GMF96770.1 unnamed protein product [Aspergillus oryzae]GMG13965.1 unnamed protein product [Aspergillus oryzae]GMG37011.1 unnamed protein product [Aspergillus oryzae]GMG54423.1 unnamed protein product [Aspergillus oryzae var. brunneus]
MEDEEDEEDEDIVYDDDEDEFGLPSITSMRKKPKQNVDPLPSRIVDPGGRIGGSASALSVGLGNSRQRANSSDIAEERGVPIRISRINKFKRLLQTSTVPLTELRNLAWSGVPDEVRAMTWQLLLGYLPTNCERRISTLERKRKEYLDGVRQAFERGSTTGAGNPTASTTGRGRGLDEAIWHQISIDVPRTCPHIQLYGYEATQRSLERILYVWAIRHPASGYVQGINDLATPFWQVFLGVYVTDLNVEEGMDPGQLPKSVLDAVEADTFWCLTKLLDGIQDNYIYAQPALPTKDWTEQDIELLLSEAFIWQSLFQDSRAHLRSTGDPSPDNGLQ